MSTLNIVILLCPLVEGATLALSTCRRFSAVALGCKYSLCKIPIQVSTVTNCKTITVDLFLYGSQLAAAECGLRFEPITSCVKTEVIVSDHR